MCQMTDTISTNVCRMCAGGPIMFSPVFSASAGLSPERAKVAMCKAISINIIKKLYTWLPRTSSDSGSPDSRLHTAAVACCKPARYHSVLFRRAVRDSIIHGALFISRAFMRD